MMGRETGFRTAKLIIIECLPKALIVDVIYKDLSFFYSTIIDVIEGLVNKWIYSIWHVTYTSGV